MNLKIIIIAILIVAGVIAYTEGLPQKGWDWFSQTELATRLFSLSGSEQKLPAPLRGILDSGSESVLTNSGVIRATNSQRDQNNLGPLHVNDRLAAAAQAKVDDMFAKQYFEHNTPDGKSPADFIKTQGYAFIIVGENLALGNFTNDDALVQAWMDSPGHRANILNNKFQEIGVATKKGMFEGKEVWLSVQEFGAPLSSCPSPNSNLKPKINSNKSLIASQQTELQQEKSTISANHFATQADYNAAVDHYNTLVESTNQLSRDTQDLVDQYNTAVNDFNACLESNL